MNQSYDQDIEFSLKTLQNGGILLYPTDTIWGIGCDATNAEAVQKIYDLKNREEKKSLIILLPDEQTVSEYVNAPSRVLLSYLAAQNKPTTGIFSSAKNVATNLVNEDGTIAIRITKDLFCKQLIQRLRKPLVSTSANISGEKSPQNFASVSDKIKNGVDYIVRHRQNEVQNVSPSSIVRLNENGDIHILR